ncbi:MAG: EAL domain-containing protein [Campylobacterales bacterium]|nr:EAL domain-containing protein [Campylobacterales bacterium]
MEFTTLKSLVSDVSITLNSSQTIAKALEVMSENSISSIVVVDENLHPIGIFTEFDALRVVSETIDKQTQLHEVMTTNPLCVEETLYIHDAYELMEYKGYRHLIVVDAFKKFVGILSEGDFIRHIGFKELSKFKVVSDVINSTPLIIKKNTSLIETATLMKNRKCDYAIVLDEHTHPIGLITERDIAKWSIQHREKTDETIELLLRDDFKVIKKDVSLQEAVSMMEKHGVHQLIVVDDSQNLIGLLSRHDLLHAIHGAYFEFLIKSIEQKNVTISNLDRQKEELTEQKIFFHTLINTIPDLIWLKDTKGVYLACNEMFEHFFNATESEIVRKTDFDFVDAELATFFREHDKIAIESGGSRTNEEYLEFSDGSYKGYFETVKTPMKNVHGEVSGILGVARDISERKHRDEEIEKIQALAHIGTWEWDIVLDEITGSSEAYRIFGIKAGENVSFKEIMKHFALEDRKKVMHDFFDISKKNKVVSSLYRVVDTDNGYRWIKTHSEFQYDNENNPIKAVGIFQDLTEQTLYEKRLETLANYDSLTGLANRALLMSHLQNSIEKAKRNKTQIALLMFDLDRFKDINDSYGHKSGDELLCHIAKRFSSRLRDGDLVSRIGGDEFAIVVEHLSHAEDAGRLASEMIETLLLEYKLSAGALIHIGVSVGIALYPEHGKNASDLLQHSDAALYKSKADGRGTYSYYTDELTNLARSRIECEHNLRLAIENNEFEVYYQPQVHIASGRILGAEALVRWNHPEKGLVPPDEFIPIAEELGLINQIGEFVLNETCRQGKIWLDCGHRLILAVNVSAHQIRYQNIPEMVEKALKKSGYHATHLELELTESALMQRQEEVIEMLHILRAKGIRLAIDDFGTGYSSLSYLKRFPIDILKIDKSFVDDIPYDADDVAIVTAIIAMGHALGFQILAEGVEREDQLNFLEVKGCTIYQGYFKSKPLPAAEFEKLLLG